MNQIAAQTLPANTWQTVHSWLLDMSQVSRQDFVEQGSDKLPYAPGNRVVDITRQIRDGTTGNGPLTIGQLRSMSVPEGNYDRVQLTLIFFAYSMKNTAYAIGGSALQSE